MSDLSTPETAKPTLTERDLSYHVATAGVAAKDEAAGLGADPAQMRSLVAAAREGDKNPVITLGGKRGMLKGFPLRQDDLLVTLCLSLYRSAFGADPSHQIAGLTVLEKQTAEGNVVLSLVPADKTPANDALRMQAIAALGFIFTQAEDAWELLDQATDVSCDEIERKAIRRDFTRSALEFAGDFTQAETETLIKHVAKLMRRVGEAETESAPGKQDSPAS